MKTSNFKSWLALALTLVLCVAAAAHSQQGNETQVNQLRIINDTKANIQLLIAKKNYQFFDPTESKFVPILVGRFDLRQGELYILDWPKEDTYFPFAIKVKFSSWGFEYECKFLNDVVNQSAGSSMVIRITGNWAYLPTTSVNCLVQQDVNCLVQQD